ncbi:ATP-binding protein [Thioalkalivibrio sp.]|uniref:sensor histidine kinase n=1 Tax=Thioalkalivibrio sp. TaxID=2093813 RepID=UPI0012D6C03C|nr:ATP-binding protein [Thioalkalivibrio sp.]TVP80804.1 MAG: HAMP domain-containing protein [Thioalkalivibrio sp.]
MSLSFNNLRNAVLVFVLLPLLAVLVALAMLALREFEQQMELRMQEDIELVARSIRLPISAAMVRRDAMDVQQALDSAFQLEQVFGVYVYDYHGELVATSGPRSPSLERRHEARLITATGSQGAFEERQGREVFSFFLPLTDAGGRIVGLLQITRDVTRFQAYIAQMRWQGGVAIVLLSLIFLFVVLIGYHRAVGRHVSRLAGAMQSVGTGARGLRVPEQGPQELRLLATTMNEMLERREDSERALEAQRAQRAELEEKLRQSEKLAAIGQLAAGVAHELGTPLGVIAGRAQRARRGVPKGSHTATEMESLLAELGRVEHIVRQLLNFARRNPLNRRAISLPALMADVVSRVRMGTQRPEIEVHAAPTDASGTLTILADPARLEQALGNLLENAIHAARERVTVAWRRITENSREMLEIAVADDGPGIADAHVDRLFEPFFTTKPTGEGTGLGLAVAHVAIEDHGGELRLDQAWSPGTRFVVTLPLSEAAADA